MQKSTIQMIKAASFEAAFVVFGVLLALAANEWRNKIAEDKASARALQSTYRELSDNQKLVEASYQYHQGTSRVLYTLNGKADVKMFSKGFVFPARVTSNAWLTASETGALKNASYEKVLTLANVYSAQKSYESQSSTIGGLIYEKLFQGGTDSIINSPSQLATIIATMSYRERELLALYEKVLEAIYQQRT